MRILKVNGKQAEGDEIAHLAQAIATPAIVTQRGGFLFKSRIDGPVFHFGILPCFVGGQRSYHYTIDIDENPLNLIGAINANGTLTALFRMRRGQSVGSIPEADKTAYRGQYAALAQFLIECGLPATFPLDTITCDALIEAKLTGQGGLTLGMLAQWGGPAPDTAPTP